ncbi:hypothetical protein X975_08225, partial [Stegodyphus mimosarum]
PLKFYIILIRSRHEVQSGENPLFFSPSSMTANAICSSHIK